MNVDTRVDDCATPSRSLPFCLKEVGRCRRAWSGDLVKQVHLRARALGSRSPACADKALLLRLQVVDLLDLPVDRLDLGTQPVVALFWS